MRKGRREMGMDDDERPEFEFIVSLLAALESSIDKESLRRQGREQQDSLRGNGESLEMTIGESVSNALLEGDRTVIKRLGRDLADHKRAMASLKEELKSSREKEASWIEVVKGLNQDMNNLREGGLHEAEERVAFLGEENISQQIIIETLRRNGQKAYANLRQAEVFAGRAAKATAILSAVSPKTHEPECLAAIESALKALNGEDTAAEYQAAEAPGRQDEV